MSIFLLCSKCTQNNQYFSLKKTRCLHLGYNMSVCMILVQAQPHNYLNSCFWASNYYNHIYIYQKTSFFFPQYCMLVYGKSCIWALYCCFKIYMSCTKINKSCHVKKNIRHVNMYLFMCT